MKKICILTTSHLADDPRIFHKEAKTLAEAGWQVVFVVRHGRAETRQGIKISPLPMAMGRISRLFLLPWNAYRAALAEKADVYHFHDPELLFFMVLLKKQTRAKVIYDVHENVPADILTKQWIPGLMRPVISRIFNFFEKKAAKHFDFIIVVNDTIKKTFLEASIHDVEIVSNFPIIEGRKNKKTVHRGVTPRIIYVGSLSREYGIKEMTDAMELVDHDADLALVGSFEDPLFEREIRSRSTKKIKLVGRVPYQTVFELLMGSDVGIICFPLLPGYMDTGFGSNKLFEYMRAGLPIIASDFPNLRAIVEGNQCGICVNSNDPGKMAKAIDYLLSHNDIAKRMGRNGKKAVDTIYNWDLESKKLLAVYHKILT